MQGGRVKRRGRSAAVSAPLSFQISPITAAEAQAFEAWFWEDLGRGLGRFSIAHPITGSSVEAKFPIADGYTIEELARDAYSLQVNIEVQR